MKHFIFVFAALIAFSSCRKKKEEVKPILAIPFTDIPADPPKSIDNRGNFSGQTGNYYLLDIKTGAQVDNADKNTTKWHVGFRIESRKVNVIINGGVSGSGGCQAQVVNKVVFDSYKNAPTEGYVTDTEKALAIPNAIPNTWIDYNSTNHTITPKAGTIIVLKTGEGRYAKMEITSFYKGAPTSPTQQSQSGYITGRFVYQPADDTAF